MFKFIVTSLVALSFTSPLFAQSHGEGHQDNHDWYQELKQPGTGYGCCSNEDCYPTKSYRDIDGVIWAIVNNEWTKIPLRAILPPKDNKDPLKGSHVCASKGGTIYCFLEGEPKS